MALHDLACIEGNPFNRQSIDVQISVRHIFTDELIAGDVSRQRPAVSDQESIARRRRAEDYRNR
jgi:hypothetical protein